MSVVRSEGGASRRSVAGAFALGWALCALGACDDSPEGACSTDAECTGGLSCLEGRCAPALDDPGGDGPGPRGPVRVFSVGLHPLMADVESQETFGQMVRDVVDAEVVPNLSPDTPNLLVFPEDVGLVAALIGERGAGARAATSVSLAFFSLSGTYEEAFGHYAETAENPADIGGMISLSVTDTLWSSLDQTFAALARDLGVWVAVTYNVADAERTTDPELIRILVDEGEAGRDFAWVALGDDVFNQTLVFDPEGELVQQHRKEYLVEMEETSLNLAYGAPGNLVAGETPFGPIGVVISKDAWMPDVLDRLALDGAALMLQPEAFSGWGIPHDEHGSWAPDVVKESGWAHVMRYPELRANVLPCLSGNLFELVFDCQSAILAQPDLDGATGSFIGQDPDVGFARVAPWVVDDDGVGSLEERRARLIEVGQRLLPGAGEPDENAYVAGTVWMDLDLGAGLPVASGPLAGVAVAPSSEGEQRRPDVAVLDDGTAFVAWEDTRRGQTRLYGARVQPGGEPREARVRVATTGEVRAPRLAAAGQVVHLVWQERIDGRWVARHAASPDGGRSFGEPRSISGAEAGDQWLPHVAADEEGRVHVAWIDGRDGALRVRYARGAAGADDGGFELDATVDAPPAAGYDTRQNQWAPSIAARGGTVVVAWTDFRAYRWEVWGAASADAGETFAAAARVDDADVPFETIHADAQSALLEDGTWLLAWTDLRERRPDHDVRVRRLDPDDLAGAGPSVALASSDGQARPQWRPAVAASGDTVQALWQDFRVDRNELRLATSDDGGASFGPDAPIDAGDAAGAQHYGPRVAAVPGGGFVAVFECTGAGRREVRVARLGP